MTPKFSAWRKSSRSQGDSGCVEVSPSECGQYIGIRDTKGDPNIIIVCTRWEFGALVASIKDDQL